MKYTKEQLQDAVTKAGDYFQSIYLEYVNDYLTIAKFALDKGITEEEAKEKIALGRKIHNMNKSEISV